MRKSRNDYFHDVWTYKKRRELFRKKYNGTVPIYKTKRYIHLTMKISQWNKEIKRLDVRAARMNKILKAVNYYFDVKIQEKVFDRKHNLARKIYYKIGLESKICGTHLARFIGRKNYNTAAIGRKSLLKIFKTNEDSKRQYYEFKKHFESVS